ncbi:MAG: hypothetical protein DKM50_03925 [Candidatus Margulisiibacteriota bacterium]|nr:MAG: hypothetical protein A2X43_01640 [Candidatus Margulisbacteria bacterium GWD2_39_127]OGI05512.1 MAG: hypothetical protein A2X42_00195 [Candidatus Margulisbacteria bacterium GWF2_38_17]PZM82284.1 MAG: hypothetical protein DKM50_03925 [Candidatus Margulisiibacteriota bacterium]HAR62970.1 hypothetical protein [Candidatus Margulisiibacteriota bacterium]HCY36993.1 hypothetical protein [Candidatus Margulisiibacteriota bacterium]
MIPTKIAILPSDSPTYFHMLNCMEKALQALGITTFRLSLSNTATHKALLFEDFEKLLHFAPDLVFFIGISGLISVSDDHLLNKYKIPYVQFFFDYPFKLPYSSSLNHNYLKKIFTWDRLHIPIFNHFGFNDITYLPLATDPDYFEYDHKTEQTYNVSFVGTLSDENLLKNYYNQLGIRLQELANTELKKKAADASYKLFTCETVLPREQDCFFTDYSCYINDRANNYKRKTYLAQLSQSHTLDIFGNSSWSSLKSIRLHSPVDYQSRLAKIFAQSKINLNLTTAQLTTALNQRVFDCFGSGNFMLTDYQEDLDYLFPKDSVPHFTSKTELIEKVDYYLNFPEDRIEITKIIQAEILQKHTWKHRMQEVLEILRKS